jgi:predicted subunit of tRNA(5-methylaminomethyl-2-thiouridylate) methyltransferase
MSDEQPAPEVEKKRAPKKGPVNQLALFLENERKVLKIILTDQTFITRWKGRLLAEHFGHDWSRLIFRAIDGFQGKYKTLPAVSSLLQILKEYVTLDLPLNEIAQHLTDTLAEPLPDIHFIKELVLEHMKCQDYNNLAVNVADAVGHKRYDEIPELFRETVMRHTEAPPPEEYEERTVAERVALEKSATGKPVQSPWPTFNANHGGGWDASAVAVIMGPLGSGKSILLVNAGVHAVVNGKTVFHFTFELSKDKTLARYDVCLTGRTHKERRADPGECDRIITTMRKEGKLGKLFVLEIPTGQCSANAVQNAVQQQMAMSPEDKPDVIVLDYLGIMMPNDPKSVDMKNTYQKLKTISEEVRALAMILKLPVVTAFQSNRGSFGKETIRKDDAADSIAVLHVVDDVLTINQTDIDRAAGVMRLYSAKSRDHADAYNIVCNVDYDNLRVTENVEGTTAYNKRIEGKKADPSSYRKASIAADGTPLEHPAPVFDPGSAEASFASVVDMGQTPFKRRQLEENGVAATLPVPPPLPPPVNA